MNDIYVTGHRNPDTDAIVAAIAYANLRQALGQRQYKAARIGAVSDEVIQQAFSATPSENHLFLPGVMSRKKQIIPMLTALWG